MKKLYSVLAGAAILAALLLVVSCGDDNDEQYNPYLSIGNDSAPGWTRDVAGYYRFESTMSVQVTLQDELLPFASEADQMCAIVNDSIRAATNLMKTGDEIYFPLVIDGDSNSGNVTIKYYCDRLHRIYTIFDWMPFTPGIPPTQDGGPYVLKFFPSM